MLAEKRSKNKKFVSGFKSNFRFLGIVLIYTFLITLISPYINTTSILAQAIHELTTTKPFRAQELQPFVDQANQTLTEEEWQTIIQDGLSIIKADWEGNIDDEISELMLFYGNNSNTEDVLASFNSEKNRALYSWEEDANLFIEDELHQYFGNLSSTFLTDSLSYQNSVEEIANRASRLDVDISNITGLRNNVYTNIPGMLSTIEGFFDGNISNEAELDSSLGDLNDLIQDIQSRLITGEPIDPEQARLLADYFSNQKLYAQEKGAYWEINQTDESRTEITDYFYNEIVGNAYSFNFNSENNTPLYFTGGSYQTTFQDNPYTFQDKNLLEINQFCSQGDITCDMDRILANREIEDLFLNNPNNQQQIIIYNNRQIYSLDEISGGEAAISVKTTVNFTNPLQQDLWQTLTDQYDAQSVYWNQVSKYLNFIQSYETINSTMPYIEEDLQVYIDGANSNTTNVEDWIVYVNSGLDIIKTDREVVLSTAIDAITSEITATDNINGQVAYKETAEANLNLKKSLIISEWERDANTGIQSNLRDYLITQSENNQSEADILGSQETLSNVVDAEAGNFIKELLNSNEDSTYDIGLRIWDENEAFLNTQRAAWERESNDLINNGLAEWNQAIDALTLDKERFQKLLLKVEGSWDLSKSIIEDYEQTVRGNIDLLINGSDDGRILGLIDKISDYQRYANKTVGRETLLDGAFQPLQDLMNRINSLLSGDSSLSSLAVEMRKYWGDQKEYALVEQTYWNGERSQSLPKTLPYEMTPVPTPVKVGEECKVWDAWGLVCVSGYKDVTEIQTTYVHDIGQDVYKAVEGTFEPEISVDNIQISYTYVYGEKETLYGGVYRGRITNVDELKNGQSYDVITYYIVLPAQENFFQWRDMVNNYDAQYTNWADMIEPLQVWESQKATFLSQYNKAVEDIGSLRTQASSDYDTQIEQLIASRDAWEAQIKAEYNKGMNEWDKKEDSFGKAKRRWLTKVEETVQESIRLKDQAAIEKDKGRIKIAESLLERSRELAQSYATGNILQEINQEIELIFDDMPANLESDTGAYTAFLEASESLNDDWSELRGFARGYSSLELPDISVMAQLSDQMNQSFNFAANSAVFTFMNGLVKEFETQKEERIAANSKSILGEVMKDGRFKAGGYELTETETQITAKRSVMDGSYYVNGNGTEDNDYIARLMSQNIYVSGQPNFDISLKISSFSTDALQYASFDMLLDGFKNDITRVDEQSKQAIEAYNNYGETVKAKIDYELEYNDQEKAYNESVYQAKKEQAIQEAKVKEKEGRWYNSTEFAIANIATGGMLAIYTKPIVAYQEGGLKGALLTPVSLAANAATRVLTAGTMGVDVSYTYDEGWGGAVSAGYGPASVSISYSEESGYGVNAGLEIAGIARVGASAELGQDWSNANNWRATGADITLGPGIAGNGPTLGLSWDESGQWRASIGGRFGGLNGAVSFNKDGYEGVNASYTTDQWGDESGISGSNTFDFGYTRESGYNFSASTNMSSSEYDSGFGGTAGSTSSFNFSKSGDFVGSSTLAAIDVSYTTEEMARENIINAMASGQLDESEGNTLLADLRPGSLEGAATWVGDTLAGDNYNTQVEQEFLASQDARPLPQDPAGNLPGGDRYPAREANVETAGTRVREEDENNSSDDNDQEFNNLNDLENKLNSEIYTDGSDSVYAGMDKDKTGELVDRAGTPASQKEYKANNKPNAENQELMNNYNETFSDAVKKNNTTPSDMNNRVNSALSMDNLNDDERAREIKNRQNLIQNAITPGLNTKDVQLKWNEETNTVDIFGNNLTNEAKESIKALVNSPEMTDVQSVQVNKDGTIKVTKFPEDKSIIDSFFDTFTKILSDDLRQTIDNHSYNNQLNQGLQKKSDALQAIIKSLEEKRLDKCDGNGKDPCKAGGSPGECNSEGPWF